MRNKQILLLFFCAVVFTAAQGQTVKSDLNYRKFRISVDAGWDYSQGKSGSVLYRSFGDHLVIPSVFKGFVGKFDGAYFLTKQYGIGLKYRYFTAKNERFSMFEYEDVGNNYSIMLFETDKFREQTHVFGPAVYARWFLGKSKWNVSANAGVVYLYNKLSDVMKERKYFFPTTGILYFSLNEPFPFPSSDFAGDYTGTTVGFTLSSGIRYQFMQKIGIGISANGLFASLSRMKELNIFGECQTVNVSRKINRIGVSAGIDFNF
jgi:hypothetical protein